MVALLIVFLPTVGGLWVWSTRNSRAGARGGLQIPAEALDFGVVWMQPDFEWILPVKNTSGEAIQITDIQTSCACSAVKPTHLTIGAGEVSEIQVRLDLRPEELTEVSQAVEPLEFKLVPVLDRALPGGIVWTIRGRVRRAFEISPKSLDFGESLVAGSQFEPATFKVRCLLPGAAVSARCEDSAATVRVVPANDGIWDYDVEVLPNADLPAGDYSFLVALKATASTGSDLLAEVRGDPSLRIHSFARVYRQIRAMPEHVYFGGAYLGESLQETITLGSVNVPFMVTKVECTPEQSLAVLALGEATERWTTRMAYQVMQKVTDAGVQHGEIRFHVTVDEPASAEEIVVSVSHEGLTLTSAP